jgi:hypothetical protein
MAVVAEGVATGYGVKPFPNPMRCRNWPSDILRSIPRRQVI